MNAPVCQSRSSDCTYAAVAPSPDASAKSSKARTQPSSTKPKFCKDCKHFMSYPAQGTPWGGTIGGYDRCEHPSLVNVIFGTQLSIDAASRRDRNSTIGCGYDALQFEAGERTPGVLQWQLDLQKEAARKVEQMQKERPAYIEQHIFPQPRAWWEFWK